MAFHYQRTPGEGVARVDGEPPGERLDRLLGDDLPPPRIGLELTAALCEILVIAEEDEATHGDPRLSDVYVTGDGVVSLGGWDTGRTTTSAPEQTPRGPVTDVYGLGRIALALLCPHVATIEPLPMEGAQAHDDVLVDFVMAADLGLDDEQMTSDVRWFLIYLPSFDHAERPDALRAWRSFIAFASTMEGPELAAWATAALRGGAPSREVGEAPTAEERLEGPQSAAGPLAARMSFSSTGGGKTLFWTRDDLEDALTEAEEPEVGGGARTGHWSRSDLIAMARGDADAPRPSRTIHDDDPAPGRPAPPPDAPPPATHRPAWTPPVDAVVPDPAPPPAPRPSPVVAHDPAPASTPRGPSTLVLVLIGAVGTMLLLSLLLGVGALVWYLTDPPPAPPPVEASP